jgi:hypothetical protein
MIHWQTPSEKSYPTYTEVERITLADCSRYEGRGALSSYGATETERRRNFLLKPPEFEIPPFNLE